MKGKDLNGALRDEKNMEGRRDIANGASVEWGARALTVGVCGSVLRMEIQARGVRRCKAGREAGAQAERSIDDFLWDTRLLRTHIPV